MTLYILKTLLLSGIFFGLYLLLLQHLTSFRWNRFYLIITSLLAMVLPVISLELTNSGKAVVAGSSPYSYTLMTFNVYSQSIQSHEINYLKMVIPILFIGLLWGLLRIVLGVIVLKRSKLNAELDQYKEASVYFNQSIETPFSFGRQIFIPMSFKNSSTLTTILEHELAHIELKHSYDKIYFSVMQALCWFNPFVYLFHKEIELIHEYEADAYVTNQLEKDYYVETLLQTLTYNQTAPTILVHSFFTHPLKTRITMLYKKSKNTIMQQAATVAITLFMSVSFISFQSLAQEKAAINNTPHKSPTMRLGDTKLQIQRPVSEGGNIDITSIRPNFDSLYNKVDVMPEFIGGNEAMMNYLSSNVKFPTGTTVTERKVNVKFIVAKDGHIASPTVRNMPISGDPFEKAAIIAVQNMPKWKPGYDRGKPVDVELSLPIVFKQNK